MDKEECFQFFKLQLERIYAGRELEQIFRIYVEDLQLQFPLGVLEIDRLRKDIIALQNDEPIQYIIGSTLFYNLRLELNNATLIPRPETEELCFYVLENEKNTINENMKVLDIGTGSGAIALLLKSQRSYWKVAGCDIAKGSLQIAAKNAKNLHLEVKIFYMDILSTKTWKNLALDVIVSNPPYITRAEKKHMSVSTMKYEPEIALFVGDDPIIMYKHILSFGQLNLKNGGRLYCEINPMFVEQLMDFYTEFQSKFNWENAQIVSDMQGLSRFFIAQKS